MKAGKRGKKEAQKDDTKQYINLNGLRGMIRPNERKTRAKSKQKQKGFRLHVRGRGGRGRWV